MPVTLPNLYCKPQDVYDFLGTEGAQLRLDDHLNATGQRITLTANALAGAVSLSITALQYPLLNGTVLEFDGAGTPGVVEVVLAATAPTGATSLTVQPLTSAINALSQATDSGVNVALAQRLVKACQYATSQVKLYCCGRYDDSALAINWSANRWATALAAKWLCKRRAQGCPKAIAEDADEALDEMKAVQSGRLALEDIGTRTSGWPFISNTTVDVAYTVAKVRVEPQISEATPTLYPQYPDWSSILLLEY